MFVYEGISRSRQKCDDCNNDIDKFKHFYMIRFSTSKSNTVSLILCNECKEKLKRILTSEEMIK